MTESECDPPNATQAIVSISNIERPIRQLDAISLVESDLLNRLISLPGRHIGFRGLGVGRSTECERAMRLVLDIGGVRTIVYLAGRRDDEQHGWYAFDDISPAQRAEFWALRGGRLKNAFEQAVAVPVSILEVAEGTVPSDWLRVSLRVGRIEIGCWLDSVSAAHALASARQRRMPVLPVLSFLTAKCAIRLRSIWVSQDELHDLMPGDVLVVSLDAVEPLRGEFYAPGFGYRYPMTYRMEGSAMIEQYEISLATDDTPMELADRRIELVVELATCRMTLGELANLREGQTLRLAKPASEMTVSLCYQGTSVARGSLVEIGELLGIRVDAIRSDASV
ncbi:FliM/FliN family flagellar motor switch protein [Burkholderia pyrrocinia]